MVSPYLSAIFKKPRALNRLGAFLCLGKCLLFRAPQAPANIRKWPITRNAVTPGEPKSVATDRGEKVSGCQGLSYRRFPCRRLMAPNALMQIPGADLRE